MDKNEGITNSKLEHTDTHIIITKTVVVFEQTHTDSS